jgi:hypothetical protein
MTKGSKRIIYNLIKDMLKSSFDLREQIKVLNNRDFYIRKLEYVKRKLDEIQVQSDKDC